MKKDCVDLEIAKELKENRYNKRSYFFTYKDPNTLKVLDLYETDDCNVSFKSKKLGLIYRPNSDEILKELPNMIDIEHYICYLQMNRTIGGLFLVNYQGSKKITPCFMKKKLPNALAKLWIYLKQEGLIEKEVNYGKIIS